MAAIFMDQSFPIIVELWSSGLTWCTSNLVSCFLKHLHIMLLNPVLCFLLFAAHINLSSSSNNNNNKPAHTENGSTSNNNVNKRSKRISVWYNHSFKTAFINIHCSKKLKEHFENTSDLNVKKYYVGYLYWYGQFNVLGTKGCHIFWWK